MSHITTLSVKVTCIDALAQACQELGVELRREQRHFTTFAGQQNRCDMAIVDPHNQKAYEIGLVAAKDGKGWEVHIDDFMGGQGLFAKVGPRAGLLLQRYGIAAAERKASADGWQSRRESLPDGSIRLVCEPKPVFAQAAAGGGWGSRY
jgi:hypothetical protein